MIYQPPLRDRTIAEHDRRIGEAPWIDAPAGLDDATALQQVTRSVNGEDRGEPLLSGRAGQPAHPPLGVRGRITAQDHPGAVAAAFRREPATTLVLVHVWNARESIFGADGSVETAYRPDPSSGAKLASLADAAGGPVFDVGETARVVDAVRRALGSGPTRNAGLEERTHPLGRFVALGALVPLAFVLRRRNLR